MVLLIVYGIFSKCLFPLIYYLIDYTPDTILLSQALKDLEGNYLLNTTVTLEDTYIAVMIIVMIIASLFLILVTNLVVIQTKNFMLN
jgi:hypothetical protein